MCIQKSQIPFSYLNHLCVQILRLNGLTLAALGQAQV